MRKGFTLIEVLIVVSIISILLVIFMVNSKDYVVDADLKKQQMNSKLLESSIKQHKLDNESLPFDQKITKEVSGETKKIIEYHLKHSGSNVTYDDIKDSLYTLDKKKIQSYTKGKMDDLDRYFSSDSRQLEGMVFTYEVMKTEKYGSYSGSYTMIEEEGGNEIKPPEPPCSTDPSTDSNIRLPLQGDGKTITTPYLVSTIGEFQGMKLSPGSYFKLKNDIEGCVTEKWNGGLGFEPLPTFGGDFQNGGFSINNITINRPLENDVGIVKQLKVEPGKFIRLKLKNPLVIGKDNVGIITGNFLGGIIHGARIEGGIVKGNDNVGGIIGLNDVHITSTILESSFKGEVSGNNNIGAMGGKTSQLDSTDSFVRGKVTGNDFVGSLIGKRSDTFGSIKNVYVDVDIKGKTNTKILNGASTGTDFITNVFYNKDKTSGITIDAGTGKTTAEMQTKTTFTGYDFTTKWIIDPSKNDGFPYLK